MDDCDRAQQHIERTESALIAIARAKGKTRELTPTGQCRYCQTFVSQNALFCDAECADAFQHERERLK